MKPLRDLIIVKVLQESNVAGVDQKIVNPNYTPDPNDPIADDPKPVIPLHGLIIATGPQVTKFHPGQIILYQPNTPESIEFKHENTQYRTVKQDFILALTPDYIEPENLPDCPKATWE